jgi:hypothetical protein
MSRAKVVSVLIDFASRSETTSRSSRPRASDCMWRPDSPNWSTSRSVLQPASSPMVRMPRRRNRSSAFFPTPQSRFTGSGDRKSVTAA